MNQLTNGQVASYLKDAMHSPMKQRNLEIHVLNYMGQVAPQHACQVASAAGRIIEEYGATAAIQAMANPAL